MDVIPHKQFDIEGCFVYQVIDAVVEVRSRPSVDDDDFRTGRTFYPGELLAVDLMRYSGIAGTGPFLRLADCSGWVFEYKDGQPCLRRLEVEDGVYCFYVDNAPQGIALRRHPNDQQHDRSLHIYEPHTRYRYLPMQRIYCDRKVTHPDSRVNFYRVQGTTGWVFDRRAAVSPTDAMDDLQSAKSWFVGSNNNRYATGGKHMLIPKHVVQTGYFAFRVLKSMTVRSEPNVLDSSRTLQHVAPGELIVCDMIRQATYDEKRLGNGPFVRLTDGSGWLLERWSNDVMLQQVTIENGLWLLRVYNEPAGINLRRQPIDRPEWSVDKNYLPEELVTCDKRLAAHNGVNFFHVQHADGWVFDRRPVESSSANPLQCTEADMKPMMGIFSISNRVAMDEYAQDGAWSPDFVRGIATARGLKEISHLPDKRLLSFEKPNGMRVHVYYATRTVATVSDNATHGKEHLFHRGCSARDLATFMENPDNAPSPGGNVWQETENGTPLPTGPSLERTEQLRRDLVQCEERMEKLVEQRLELLVEIQEADVAEAALAEAYREKAALRMLQQQKEAVKRKQEEMEEAQCLIQ